MECATLNLPGFLTTIARRNQAKPLTVYTITEPDMRKGGLGDGAGNWPNPYHGKIVKIAKRNVWSGTAYTRHVNLQRAREGQPVDHRGQLVFFSGGRLWRGAGVYVNRFIVRHKPSGRLYLACKPPTTSAGEPGALAVEYQWRANRRRIKEQLIEPWLSKPRASSRQQTAKPIFWRVIELNHIVSIVCDGRTYNVEISSSAAAA